MKKCKKCSSEIDNRKTYCGECRIERDMYMYEQRQLKKTLKKKEQLDVNFKSLNPSREDLTPRGFNKVSLLKFQNYHNHFRMSWLDILDRYEKKEEFVEYLKEMYGNFYEETGNYGYELFQKYVGVSQSIMQDIGHDELKNHIDVIYNRKSIEELKDNYFRLINIIGRPPIVNSEIKEFGSVSLNTYVKRLNLEGNHIEALAKHYLSKREYESFLVEKRENERLNEIKRLGSLGGIYHNDMDFLIDELKEYVSRYLVTNGFLPSQIEYETAMKRCAVTFKKRLNKTYKQMLSLIGYEVSRASSKKEYHVVKLFDEILGDVAEPQKYFEWLHGMNGWRLRCDAFYENYNLVVEYDGQGHTLPIDFAGRGRKWAMNNMFKTQANDRIKNKVIPEKGMFLVRVAFDEPHMDADFLRMRLYEHGVMPKGTELISDSLSLQRVNDITPLKIDVSRYNRIKEITRRK